MSAIKRLREIGDRSLWRSYYSSQNSDRELIEEIEDLLGDDIIERDFEEGGRWSNFESEVFKVEEGDEVAYFRVTHEVPATESQEGMDSSYEIEEVEPHQVMTTIYRRKN